MSKFWCLGFSWNFLSLLSLYLELWFKQMYTLKTVLRITHHAHFCTIHEMYDYDWGKLVICLNIDDIIDTSTWRKRNVLLVYSFKNFLYQKIKSCSTAFQCTDLYVWWLLTKESCILKGVESTRAINKNST